MNDLLRASAARRRAFDRRYPEIRKAAAVARHREARARHMGTAERPLPLLGALGSSTVAAMTERAA